VLTDDDPIREAAAGWEMPETSPAAPEHGDFSEPSLPIGGANWPDEATNRCRRCYGIGCPVCFDTGREDLDHEVELRARDNWRTRNAN
jgi:hypothetical protein